MSQDPSPFGSPNPYGQGSYGASNPYTSPNYAGPPGGQPPVGAKLMAPAIGLLLTGVLGMLMTIVSIVMAMGPPPPIDPNAPPFLQEFQKGANGPQAVAIQSFFVLVNVFIIAGGALMLMRKIRGVGLAASVVAMLNVGNCCCVLGIPIGIWSLVILLQPDVKAAFDQNS